MNEVNESESIIEGTIEHAPGEPLPLCPICGEQLARALRIIFCSNLVCPFWAMKE